jgi:hypothetical protein
VLAAAVYLKNAEIKLRKAAQKANVRMVWLMAPFGETVPVQFAAGGFAAGNSMH